jgi:phytoene/squalene synthetase
MHEEHPREGEPPAGAHRPGETRHGDTPADGPRGGEVPMDGPRSGAALTGKTLTGGGDAPKALSPSRYLAWLYSTDAQKPVLAALLNIESEIASGLRPGLEHHVAHARLQWWSEEAERAAEGRPVHPVTRELVKALANASGNAGSHAGRYVDRVASAAAGLTAHDARFTAHVAGFVDTAVWDLASATFETRKELMAYCERWATAMFETADGLTRAAARDLATDAAPATVETPAAGASAPSPWKVLGAAVREVELLADAARDAQLGRVRIPLDELDRAGVDANALVKLPWPAPLAALVKARHEALRATIAKGVAALMREEQTAQRGLLVWVALTWRLSTRAERALPNVILPRRYDALADGWQAWRAARRAAAGKLRLD